MSAPAILVTGAGGFVCSAIARAFAGAGWRVAALDGQFDERAARALADVERIEGALPEALGRVAGRSFDVVIHGAAITASPEALGLSRAAYLRANTDPLTAVLARARSAGAGQFVFLSSMGVFAPGDGPLDKGLVTEAAAPGADCPYCVAKRAGEALVAGAAEPGFRTLSLRLGNVCGPEEVARETRPRVSRLRVMVEAARDGGEIRVPLPGAMREWAWLPDLARGVVALIAGGGVAAPVLHAGTPPAIGDRDLAEAIAARAPGARVVEEGGDAPERPPMGSGIDSPLARMDWMQIDDILDRLMPVEAAR